MDTPDLRLRDAVLRHQVINAMNMIISFGISFLAAVLSAMGMVGGGVLLIYLTAVLGVDQLEAQGINLAFFVPAAVVALIFHIRHKLVELKTAGWFILAGLAGVAGGALLAMWMPREVLSKCFGALLLLMGIRELWPKKQN
ncbi:MAG: sulfite exporter TauE/SafE family protein [Oscillospiraceae bacterium]|nr:sulfite exporter TauE/SafE family protein [Oscillospiraceae bacterium]